MAQTIDLHRFALIPAALTTGVPTSLYQSYEKQSENVRWVRRIGAIASVLLTWMLTASWCHRLSLGRRVKPGWRRSTLRVLIIILGPWMLLGVFMGVRGGWEGPFFTETAGFLPLTAVTLALVELRVLTASILKSRLLWLIPPLMAVSFFMAGRIGDDEYEEYQRKEGCAGSQDASCFQLPFMPSPHVFDVTFLTGSVIVIPALAQSMLPKAAAVPSHVTLAINLAFIIAYWSIWVAVLRGLLPIEQPPWRHFRSTALWGSALLFGFSFLRWHVGGPHGPEGMMGASLGFLLVFLALLVGPRQRQMRLRGHEVRNPTAGAHILDACGS